MNPAWWKKFLAQNSPFPTTNLLPKMPFNLRYAENKVKNCFHFQVGFLRIGNAVRIGSFNKML